MQRTILFSAITLLSMFVATDVALSEEASKAPTAELCIYTENGFIREADSRSSVPEALREKANCVQVAKREKKIQKEVATQESPKKQDMGTINALQNLFMAKPDEIDLEGSIRKEKIDSSIGTIEVRWPRKVEALFGRTPLRATQDAARAVSKVVRSAAFPTELQEVNLPWSIVFLDENLPTQQIPGTLISNCHPGWMTPPANIYLVAQRIVAGCGDKKEVSASVADSRLAEVMIHEMGHALEFHLLKNSFGQDRMRAEGFATWFETFASANSSVMSQGEIKARTFALAKASREQKGKLTSFSGSPFDYAHASMFFTAIVDKHGLRGLMDVYQKIRTERLSFFQAAEKQLNWDRERFEQEISRMIEKK